LPMLQTLRRLQKEEARRKPVGARSLPLEGKDTRETGKSFLERFRDAADALAVEYPAGLIPEAGIPEPIRDAEERMEAAFRAGDYGEADMALRVWVDAWRAAIKEHNGRNGRNGSGGSV